MATSNVKCSVAFHNMKIDELDAFAVGVRDGIFENITLFPTPPFDQPTTDGLITDYVNKRGAYKQGGAAQKGPFLAAKTALIDRLDAFAEYVDDIAQGDANIITEGGFTPTKAVSSEKPAPAQPENIELERGATGEIDAECPKVDFAEYYGCLCIAGESLPAGVTLNSAGQFVFNFNGSASPAPPSPSPLSPSAPLVHFLDVTKSRKKKFTGLVPGVTYYFYFYSGNATGVSPLSEVRSIMCA